MKTGAVKTGQPEITIVPLPEEMKTNSDVTVENMEIVMIAGEKSAAKFNVKERFIRFKKSLRKRSVSIL